MNPKDRDFLKDTNLDTNGDAFVVRVPLWVHQ